MAYVYLSIAIVAEVVATSALKASEGFTVLWPSIICVVGYAVALYLLSLSLKEIPVGIAYAMPFELDQFGNGSGSRNIQGG